MWKLSAKKTPSECRELVVLGMSSLACSHPKPQHEIAFRYLKTAKENCFSPSPCLWKSMFLLAGLLVKVGFSLLSLRWSVGVLGGLLASLTTYLFPCYSQLVECLCSQNYLFTNGIVSPETTSSDDDQWLSYF